MSVPRILELDNTIRDYAWGSPTAIPKLLGIEPTGRPAAELWIGAHPDSPSRAVAHADQPGLDALIAADPAGILGAGTVARFGARLPFLLKLLAAERALSIQVHPNRAQAEAGYAAEETAGVDRNGPERNYRDPNHKPEMAYAITEFDAFCGFRPVHRTAELIDALGVPELSAYRDLLVSRGGLRAVFTTLLTLGGAARDRLIDRVLASCRRLAEAGGDWAPTARASLLAAEDFPGDIGSVLALLLNYVRLAPGEAIFLGAGNVHAYLRGVCVELLANSDNVLRCGLTPKHIDVPELVRIADFAPVAEPRHRPSCEAADRVDFRPPVPDFELSVRRAAAELPGERPWLVLAGERPVTLTGPATEQRLVLPPWRAAFVTAGAGSCFAEPAGRMFLASVADG
jgi:mannose-6-phosphate isomerase